MHVSCLQRRAALQDSEDEDSAMAQRLQAEYNGSGARPRRAAASVAKRRLASVRAGTLVHASGSILNGNRMAPFEGAEGSLALQRMA